MKFGGASVATPESFSRIADIILARKKEFQRIVVVVSAMGDTTDELLALAHKVHPNPPRRELDMLLSVGERISVALLAMALDTKGAAAISFTGSQSGIVTTDDHSDARIMTVKPHRVLPHLDGEKIVIVAGFQGVSRNGEITTLGRGGSDTTAVALGIAMQASRVEFFKDVDGIYDCDPRSNPHAKILHQLEFQAAIDIVSKGHQVLHKRSVLLAQKNALPLCVLPFEDYTNASKGTRVGPVDRVVFAEAAYED